MKRPKKRSYLIREESLPSSACKEGTATLSFLPSSLNEKSVKKQDTNKIDPIQAIGDELGKRCSPGRNFIAGWREEQPKVIRFSVLAHVPFSNKLHDRILFYLGLNDFEDYSKSLTIPSKDEIIAFLQKIDLPLLVHLYDNYWEHEGGAVHVHIDMVRSKATFTGDPQPNIYKNAREGVFDDLLTSRKQGLLSKDDALKFPSETGNKFVSFFGNIFLLSRLCDNEKLIKQMVFDEYKLPWADLDGTINSAMSQHVVNRRMISRQLELLDKHFWIDAH